MIETLQTWAGAVLIVVGTVALCVVISTIALGVLAGITHLVVDSWSTLLAKVRK